MALRASEKAEKAAKLVAELALVDNPAFRRPPPRPSPSIPPSKRAEQGSGKEKRKRGAADDVGERAPAVGWADAQPPTKRRASTRGAAAAETVDIGPVLDILSAIGMSPTSHAD